MKTPKATFKIFLTDYASYNNGTQFEFGHWVYINGFEDEFALMDYIKDHFKKADKISPLSGPREEIMVTDFEGFPETLYSESMNFSDFKKLYKLKNFLEEKGMENLENKGDNLLELHNEFCSEKEINDVVVPFDDYNLGKLIGKDPFVAFNKGANANINWTDDYLVSDALGRISSTNNPSKYIDELALIDWITEEKL